MPARIRTPFRPAPLVVAAALGLVACGREPLLQGLDERQAAEVVVALDDGGVVARKTRGSGPEEGYAVEVARGDQGRSLRILAARDLPRPRPPGFAEVFAKGGLVPTATEERARFQHALAGELARSLEAVDGVVGARVHLALAEADPLRPGERAPAHAAVLLRCRRAACDAVRALEPGVRALVAGAADRLEPGAVAVVVAEAQEPPTAREPRRSGWPALAGALSAAAALGAALALGGWAATRLRRPSALAGRGARREAG